MMLLPNRIFYIQRLAISESSKMFAKFNPLNTFCMKSLEE